MMMMNNATSMAPNNSPVFQKLMLPVSSWMPYRPLIGALIESRKIFWGSCVTPW